MASHPAEQFQAPGSIQKGSPLKYIITADLVDLISESFENIYQDFDAQSFRIHAKKDLDRYELKARAKHIADTLQRELPADFEESSEILIRALGPELTETENNGLRPFFYLAHAEMIARFGASHFKAGMRANYEITKRFTAEFSIRSYIAAHRKESLKLLSKWTHDSNPHVRRLASEGSRPRLPWAIRLTEIDRDPSLTLPLLECLKDDDVLYVRRSVANHLGDIGKNNLPTLLETCSRWLEESHDLEDPLKAKNRRWIIRHALRHPAKIENAEARRLRKMAA
jgi:3-methyladenine DNA glycosylase AlkC